MKAIAISPDLATVLEQAWPGERAAAKRALLRHALACFSATGVEATTIDALKSGSGLSVGSIYHHFGNKEGVAAALFFAGFDDQSRAIAARTEAAADDGRALVAALVGAYADWVTQLPELARYLFMARETVETGPQEAELAQRLEARYAPIDARLARGMAAGAIQRLPAELIPSLVLGGAESYCRAWLAGRRRKTPAHHAPMLAEAAWRGIAA